MPKFPTKTPHHCRRLMHDESTNKTVSVRKMIYLEDVKGIEQATGMEAFKTTEPHFWVEMSNAQDFFMVGDYDKFSELLRRHQFHKHFGINSTNAAQ